MYLLYELFTLTIIYGSCIQRKIIESRRQKPLCLRRESVTLVEISILNTEIFTKIIS